MNKGIIKIFKFILIIGIIATAAVVIGKAGFKMLEQKKYDDIETDLLLIQAKVKIIKGKADVNSNTDGYIGTKVSQSENEDMKEFFRSISIDDADFEKYYVLNHQDFENMGIASELKNIEDNIFIVNYDTAEVIYKKGIEIEGVLKYRLSEIVVKAEKKIWILHNRMLE